ncbi:hypothetical protein D3C84_643170 [compost metagenome]
MVGNGGGVGVLVVGLALRNDVFLVSQEGRTQRITDPDHFEYRSGELQTPFHIGAPKGAQAGSRQQGYQVGVLDRHGHGRVRAELDLLAIPEQQA